MTVTINGSTGIDKVQPGAAAGQVLTVNGITFPASQVASADANTLDDYEEGTWTPQVTISGSNVTTTPSDVRYTKVGRLVYINASISFASGSATGSVKVTGLPFSSSGNNFFRGISVNDSFVNPQQYYLYVSNGSTQIELRVMGTSTATGSRDLAGSDLLSNTTLSMYLGFVYSTST